MSNFSSENRSLVLHLTNDIDLRFIYCPSGSFMMGANDDDAYASDVERPQHQVDLSLGFWVSEAPITRQQISIFTQQIPSKYEGKIDSPASQYTFQEVLDFCNLFSSSLIEQLQKLRLNIVTRFEIPTEAQWEYACRAGTTTKWYFGDDPKELINHSWYGMSTIGTSLPSVKQKKCNPWGLYDLYGMVYEWCLDDPLHYKKISQSIDPLVLRDVSTRGIESKIARGGCINDSFEACRSSQRKIVDSANSGNELIGFRLVINEIR